MKTVRQLILCTLLIAMGCYPIGDPIQTRIAQRAGLVVNPADTLPMRFMLADRSPIAALYVCSVEGRSATNPAGWFNDKTLDISDIPALRARFMAYADQSISVMNEAGAKRMNLWDCDGARHSVYLGCPDQTKRINPEIAGIIDDFYARFRAAGKTPGCTLRPEDLDEATGRLIPAADPYASLLRKAAYARTQWKCKVFYCDTNLWAAPGVYPPQYVGTLPSSIFERLHKALPDVLFMPEHEQAWGNGSIDLGYYQTTVPYQELRMGDTGTPAAVRATVPGSFSALNISARNPGQPLDVAMLRAAVQRGDVLILNGWWRNAVEMDAVKAAYQAN